MARQSGFSYMELLIATLLITILLVPALEAMQSGIRGSGIHTQLAQNQYRMISKMEQTLALPFAELLQQADLVADPSVPVPAPFLIRRAPNLAACCSWRATMATMPIPITIRLPVPTRDCCGYG